MSGWRWDMTQRPRPDPVPARYLARVADRRAVADIRIPMAIGWALVDDVYFVHDAEGQTTATRLRYHVSRRGIVTTSGHPSDMPAPAGLTWRVPDASATADASLLPGVPVMEDA